MVFIHDHNLKKFNPFEHNLKKKSITKLIVSNFKFCVELGMYNLKKILINFFYKIFLLIEREILDFYTGTYPFLIEHFL